MKINNVEYGGQDVKGLTFGLNTTGDPAEGDAVILTADGEVGLGSDTNPLYGKLAKIEQTAALTPSGKCTVERTGIINFKKTAAAIAAGPQTLVVDGAGLVKTGAGGRAVNVIGTGTIDSVEYVAVDFG